MHFCSCTLSHALLATEYSIQAFLPICMADAVESGHSVVQGMLLVSATESGDCMCRTDGAAILDILMDAAPSTIAQQFSDPILRHYATLLSPGQRSNSLSSRSIPSLHKVPFDPLRPLCEYAHEWKLLQQC